MLRRYSNYVCLLDLTCNYCQINMPIYCLAKKTNVDFQLVGIIIPQEDNAASISEGLELL